MKQIDIELIEYEIKLDFHFVEYPTNVSPNLWKDPTGGLHRMEDMGIDHLQACIRKVKKAIDDLDNGHRGRAIKGALTPIAEQKLKELELAFSRKVQF